MDQFENNYPEQETQQPAAPVYPQFDDTEYVPPYRVKKASPFADSPYVMERPVRFEPERPKKQGGKGWKGVLAILLVVALVATSSFATATFLNTRWEQRLNQLSQQFENKLNGTQQQTPAVQGSVDAPAGVIAAPTGDVLTPAQVYAMNVNSVVMVYNKVNSGTSTGSGFILSTDGYVVTNYHVVEGQGKLTVVTNDKTEHTAALIGYDQPNDVALLKVEAEGLQAVALGSSDALVVGDQVVAIGNPLGELTATQTVGYVSAKERDVTTDGFAINMIQTDAAINSGNSGGPLFNMYGQVVGITTAKYSGTSASGASIEGIGFAIPIDDVSGLLSDLANYGYITGAYLGISVSDMDANAAAYYGMPVGAYVVEVVTGYCAAEAGIQEKDIIVDLGGHKVTNVNSLSRALRNFSAGDTTTITIYRGGRELVLNITLDEKPSDLSPHSAIQPTDPQDMPEEGNFEDWYNYLKPFFGQGGNG